eukprot:GHVS01001749.1.p1 GENE.GHVS01001749.1~~GHVS01001749.1.p1  ORF type:complete len:181 (-),score=19.84 GHVS01001749.1:356-898(-)
MVQLHVKTVEDSNQFLFSTSVSLPVEHIIQQLVDLHNLRVKSLQLADACKAVATHGPLRPEDSRGLSDEVAKLSGTDVKAYGEPTCADPGCYRTGVPPEQSTADTLMRTATEVEDALSAKQVSTLLVLRIKLGQPKATQERLNMRRQTNQLEALTELLTVTTMHLLSVEAHQLKHTRAFK